MGNYYALLKVKLNGDVDLDTTLSIGELLVKDIQDLDCYPNIWEVSLESVGKENPVYLDINPLLNDE